MADQRDNARRFINSYNKIDNTLRAVYNFKANMTFTDMVRRTVSQNSVVRMYEDDLVTYARLRNAIVHNSEDGAVIAEPHDDVAERMEKIARLICTPPLAFNALCRGDVHTVSAETCLAVVVAKIRDTDHSNLPVMDDVKMLGVINNKLLVECIGDAMRRGVHIDTFLKNTSAGEVVRPSMYDVYYTILPKAATLEQVLTRFENNRKLSAVILTETGTNLETPVGIITPADILDINNILDSY